jgi:hypothetical protein
MKKPSKRKAAKSSSKRPAARAAKGGSRKKKTAAKSKKRSPALSRSKIKGTAKKAAKAAAAAGLAAIDTVLREISPGEKKPGVGRTEEKHCELGRVHRIALASLRQQPGLLYSPK